MSGALSEDPGRPGPGAAAGTVFRSELNPGDFLYRAAYLYPDEVAVAGGKRRYSYRELAERSWRLANALRSAALAKGDRVAALLFNSPAMLEAHFGVPAADGILVAVITGDGLTLSPMICGHALADAWPYATTVHSAPPVQRRARGMFLRTGRGYTGQKIIAMR
ncbi:MAG: AMP-binding protein [Streptosporangiaceae bacterium]